MKIAFLSGKGGAGKTFVAVNLAYYAQTLHNFAEYFDCDVEEPNGHLFFDSPVQTEQTVYTAIPVFNREKCAHCRRCVDFCKFNALVYIKNAPMLLPELCHACGGCTMVCPSGAIKEEQRPIGKIETRQYENIACHTGILNTGEASGIKIIRDLLQHSSSEFSVIDCPPGSACSVMESIMPADLCVLVAEPTNFGLHNLNMVYELTKILHKKTAVIINKDQKEPFEPLNTFCQKNNLPVLASIPFNKELARTVSEGTIAFGVDSKTACRIEKIYAQLKAML